MRPFDQVRAGSTASEGLASSTMFVVGLRYTVPLEDVDAVRRHHLTWVDELVAGGTIIAAGRLTDSTGGILIMRAPDRETVDRLLAEDPYARSAVAEYEVTEFTAGRIAPGLEHLADGL